MTQALTDSFLYLFNRADTRIEHMFSHRLTQHGLTIPMYRVLVALHQQEDQNLGGLSAVTAIEMSTLSRLVKAMAAQKLVTRERPNTNGRMVLINLTEEGSRLTESMMSLAQEFEDVATKGFSEEERRWLNAALQQIENNLEAVQA